MTEIVTAFNSGLNDLGGNFRMKFLYYMYSKAFNSGCKLKSYLMSPIEF